jgi:hypothetical protein
VVPAERGFWLYDCGDHHRVSLAELRAGLETGRISRLSKVASSRWAERLDFEAGLRVPRAVAVVPPEGCSDGTRKVAIGMALFLGLRDDRMAGEAFPFARAFVIAYCGVTNDEARWAMRTLERASVIRRDGKSRNSVLWRVVG